MKRLLLMFSIVLLFAVVGCSPSEKSIEKAVAKEDYQYIEKYLSNPKYWNDPNKSASNVAAVEGLILLNRIDSAVTLYKENKGKPSEEMIVKAFVDALTKSKLQKMPEKLIELIDDSRNNASDAILRRTTVEIEPAKGVSKIKHHVEKAINERIAAYDIPVYKEYMSEAILWDIKGIFTEPLNLVIQQYSELENIHNLLWNAKNNLRDKEQSIELGKRDVEDKEQPVKEAREDINDLRSGNPYNLAVMGCLQFGKLISEGRAFATKGREVISPYSYCLTDYQKRLKEAEDNLNQAKKELKEAIASIKDIKKTIADYQSQIKSKLPEVEKAEAQLLESLDGTGAG